MFGCIWYNQKLYVLSAQHMLGKDRSITLPVSQAVIINQSFIGNDKNLHGMHENIAMMQLMYLLTGSPSFCYEYYITSHC